jgi:hypothetical protein
MSEEFPADLKQFITQHIESLAELEMLLLLRQDPQRWWEPAEVAKVLYTSEQVCASQLAALARRGFFEASPPPEARYRYRPASADIDRLLAALAATYQERRVAVITLIYSKPVDKVQTFADAFRLRRED